MKTKLFTLFLALAASVGTIFAAKVQIGNLYYDLDATNKTARVTSQNSGYPYWSVTITTANIPSSVEYEGVTYSVTSIGYYAFRGCTGLTSVTIPNSVTSIGEYAFSGCTNLPVIDNIRYADTYLVEAADKTLSTYTIKDGTKWIGTEAFSGCHGWTSVTIPNSVTSIGYEAFGYCTGLTSVTIPNSVTSIGYYAFRGCTGLTSVTIPNSVTSIGIEAFYDCSGLTSVTIPNSVTSIDYGAFSRCKGMTSVTIGNSVTLIGEAAFFDCTGLTSVTIPNSVTAIGASAFASCTGLTSVTCKASTPPACGFHVFYEVDKSIPLYVPAKSVEAYKASYQWEDFGDNIKPIQAEEAGCTKIGNLYYNLDATNKTAEVTSQNSGFPYWSATITTANIPSSVEYESVTYSVTSIGAFAFYQCTSLTSVTIPNSVTSIGAFAFYCCSGLTSITCEASTPPACGIEVFIQVDKSIPLYVPAKSVEAYKAADQWKDFGDNIKPIQAPEALDEILESSKPEVLKFIKNGQLFILRNGGIYNAQGARVE